MNKIINQIIRISGIKKVSHNTEKPQEPRKYAILGALFSTQTQSSPAVSPSNHKIPDSHD